MSRIGLRVADDHVVEEFDFENLRRVAELARNHHVGRARRGVPARVIVLCGEPNYVE